MIYQYKDESIFVKCDMCGHNYSENISGTVIEMDDVLERYTSLNTNCPGCGNITGVNMEFSQETYDKEKENVEDAATDNERLAVLRIIRAKREDFINERASRIEAEAASKA